MIMGGNTMINDKEWFSFKIFGHQVEVIVVMSELCPEGKMNMAGWWFQPTPLKNNGVRQLGLQYYSQLNGKIKAMFQTTNQIYKYSCFD